MKRITRLIAAVAAPLLLTGCLGGAFDLGSAASPPTNIRAYAGDTSITITWDSTPNVEYWVFAAPGNNVTTDNWTTLGGTAAPHATSPHTIYYLTNDTEYSFTINGRTNGGAGGTGSPTIAVTPRLAGASWTSGSALSANDLNGVAYGSVFVAVGANGALYSSPDFDVLKTPTWTALTNPSSTDLYAANYASGIYLAAGANGTILYSTDAVTWTQQTSNTAQNLYAIGSNGLGGHIAVGAAGAITESVNGTAWTALTPPAAANGHTLRGIAYGNATWVAVGDNGTLLTSTDATTWNTPSGLSLASTINLKSIAYGLGVDPATKATTGYLFVAVGDNGMLLTSSDGITWTQSSVGTTDSLKSVTFGRQFVAVGDAGRIFTSRNGTTWTTQSSGTTGNLKAITHSLTNYAVTGVAGTNLSAL